MSAPICNGHDDPRELQRCDRRRREEGEHRTFVAVTVIIVGLFVFALFAIAVLW